MPFVPGPLIRRRRPYWQNGGPSPPLGAAPHATLLMTIPGFAGDICSAGIYPLLWDSINQIWGPATVSGSSNGVACNQSTGMDMFFDDYIFHLDSQLQNYLVSEPYILASTTSPFFIAFRASTALFTKTLVPIYAPIVTITVEVSP